MDPDTLAAALGAGAMPECVCSSAAEFYRPVGAKGRGQAQRTDVAGAREAAEDVTIGVLRKQFGNARIKRLNRRDEHAQLRRVWRAVMCARMPAGPVIISWLRAGGGWC